jgi:hypothetical protein
MKNLGLLILLILFALIIASCKVDRCKDTTCLNNSICENGNCNCIRGYEGNTCENEIRAKYLGNYVVSTYCPSDTLSGQLTISGSPDDIMKVNISGIYSAGSMVTGTINSDGHIIIDNQSIGNDKTLSGSITKEGSGTITVTNTINGSSETCSFMLNL